LTALISASFAFYSSRLDYADEAIVVRIHTWKDHRVPATTRVMIQRGDCDKGQCGQFAISIATDGVGVTVRFQDREEFERFVSGHLIETEVTAS